MTRRTPPPRRRRGVRSRQGRVRARRRPYRRRQNRPRSRASIVAHRRAGWGVLGGGVATLVPPTDPTRWVRWARRRRVPPTTRPRTSSNASPSRTASSRTAGRSERTRTDPTNTARPSARGSPARRRTRARCFERRMRRWRLWRRRPPRGAREEALAVANEVSFARLPPPKSAAAAAADDLRVRPSFEERYRTQILAAKARFKTATPEEIKTLAALRRGRGNKLLPTRDVNGFRRQIIALAPNGALVSLHNGDGRALWRRFLGAGLDPEGGCVGVRVLGDFLVGDPRANTRTTPNTR